jgi:hypothetical protein
MGFMGLKHWGEVDGAADLHADIEKSVSKVILKGLKDPGNAYNPPGIINIALILEEAPGLAKFIPDELLNKIEHSLLRYDYSDWNKDLKVDIKRIKSAFKKNFG